MLSIIIPTLNEEDHLPKLLDSIKRQNYIDYEIIISDANSKDGTLKIAKQHNCILVKGGLPSKGRNNGAKSAKKNILFFLDADTVLHDDFLKNSLEEFNSRKLDIATFCLNFHPGTKFFSLITNLFYNKVIILSEKVLPHAAIGIVIRKDIFEKVGGYNEAMNFAEDRDLAKRTIKHGKFGVIRSAKLSVSDRRFRKDGWIKTMLKYFLCELQIIFLGSAKSDKFKYKFGHYKERNSNKKI